MLATKETHWRMFWSWSRQWQIFHGLQGGHSFAYSLLWNTEALGSGNEKRSFAKFFPVVVKSDFLAQFSSLLDENVLLLSNTCERYFSERCVGIVQQDKVSQGWICHSVTVIQWALVTLACKLGRTDQTRDKPPPEVAKVPWGWWLCWSPFTVNLLVLPLKAKWKRVCADHWGSVSG